MVPNRGFRCSVAYFAVACYVFAVTCTALVVTAPNLQPIGTTTERVETKIDRSVDLKLRIRSTHMGDIPEIASMLTHALLEEEGQTKQQYPSPLNFRFRKIRSGVAPLLQSRMEAIQFGDILRNQHASILQTLTQTDQLRLLWSNDGFRNQIETAASLSNEPHIWKEHNFMCAPQNFDWLFHKMMTAENTLNGEIVGFCEIAMLSQPEEIVESTEKSSSSYWDDECSLEETLPGAPTIMNLVTSREYRRRGVGSAVMNSAMNYLQKSSPTWNEMALYVEADNDAAIRMYEGLGFRKVHLVEPKKQWYMVREFSDVDSEEPIIPKVKDVTEAYDMYLI